MYMAIPQDTALTKYTTLTSAKPSDRTIHAQMQIAAATNHVTIICLIALRRRSTAALSASRAAACAASLSRLSRAAIERTVEAMVLIIAIASRWAVC